MRYNKVYYRAVKWDSWAPRGYRLPVSSAAPSRARQWRLWRRSSLRRLVHSHFSCAHTPSHPLPPSLPGPVRTRAKLISSATTIIRRPSPDAVFLFRGGGGLRHIEGVGVATVWPGCVARPPAFRRTPYPPSRAYHPYAARSSSKSSSSSLLYPHDGGGAQTNSKDIKDLTAWIMVVVQIVFMSISFAFTTSASYSPRPRPRNRLVRARHLCARSFLQ